MQLKLSGEKGVTIQEGMIGLFFEDINYAADGGLYAEMIENRSFEFVDCYGTAGDYYTKPDYGYGWYPTKHHGMGKMEYVMGSAVNRNNPHYLRFEAEASGQGFENKAYEGIYLKKGEKYRVSFYARMVFYKGDLCISVEKGGSEYAKAMVECIHAPERTWQKWHRYDVELKALDTIRGGKFMITLTKPGIVEFDFISMMPEDAVAGVFRKDLFDLLKDLHPGFLRFPGGCIIEGNTLENRYRWKESVGIPEGRKSNFNRWAVHGTTEENGWHTQYSHYNQTLGIGFYEYFLLCEMIGAKPIPVVNVGLACQYQSYELVEMENPAFEEYIQDALDLIEFANGDTDSYWGGVRTAMGHPAPFGLTMIGIGNEQWQTEKVDFFARYEAFEKAIHDVYPEIKLIGSAGPDITSERYDKAWEFYQQKCSQKEKFCYAVDEHYYVKPEWFYEHVNFYDNYPRNVKVFAGEYAAHPASGMNMPEANTLWGALAEAAFLTGIERNADVVVLTSYAPLFARIGYAQWSPDMIWFDEAQTYLTPSYYVQQLYSENMGTMTMPMDRQEKTLKELGIYVSVSVDENTKEVIIKAVNKNSTEEQLEITAPDQWTLSKKMQVKVLTDRDYKSAERDNGSKKSGKVCVYTEEEDNFNGILCLPEKSFVVARIGISE